MSPRRRPLAPAIPPEPTGPEEWAHGAAPLPPGHSGFGEATPPQGVPTISPPPVAPPSVLPPSVSPPPVPPPAVAAEHAEGVDDRLAELTADRWRSRPAGDPLGRDWRTQVLPQRIPAEPDVPALPEGVAEEVEAAAEAPELARIATYLRHDDVPPTREGFDVDEVLNAARAVPGVRGARLRRNPGRVHTLRLDLADGADPGQVSRMVARLLSERMGLSAALPGPETAAAAGPPAAAGPSGMTEPTVPTVPAEPVETYRGTARGPAGDAIGRDAQTPYQPRRRYPGAGTRGRAAVEPRPAAGERPSRPVPARSDGVRVVLDHVQVSTFGLDATVQVRLRLGGRRALGEASGPAVDGYVLRLCAVSAAAAVDQLLVAGTSGAARGRCFVEHAALVPFGSCDVAVAVVLLVCDGWVEQLSGSAVVTGDPRQAVVRATLAAVNRRLESLLS